MVNIGFSNFVNEEKIIAIADLSTKITAHYKGGKKCKRHGNGY